MIASTLRYHETQEQANKIAALSVRLYAHPISPVLALKVPFIWNIGSCWRSAGFHFASTCKGSGFILCCRFRVLAAFLAIYDLGWIHSQGPCPHKVTAENSARSAVQYCYAKPRLSTWPQRNRPQDESKRGLGFFFPLFHVLTILTTLPFASLNRNKSSSGSNCHKCELVALWTIANVRKYLDFVTVSSA